MHTPKTPGQYTQEPHKEPGGTESGGWMGTAGSPYKGTSVPPNPPNTQ